MKDNKFIAWDKQWEKMSEPIQPFINNQLFFFFEGFGTRAGNHEHLIIIRYAGIKVKEDREIYEGHILKIELSAIDNNDGDDFVSPKKTLFAEVVINPKSGAKAKIRKTVHDADWCDGKCFRDDPTEPSCFWNHKCLSIGQRINIRKQDEIVGNIYENQGLLK